MTDPAVPQEGHYRRRLVKSGPWCAVKIWRGYPIDPVTQEVLFERPVLWRALLSGEDIDVFDVWPECSGQPVTEDEYGYLLALYLWAVANDPASPAANPHKSIDINKTATVF